MYYPDLSPYQSRAQASQGALNIGWLDKQHEFPVGEISEEFKAKLWRFVSTPVVLWRGVATCPFCGAREPILLETRGQETVGLGTAEIRVFHHGKVFAAPDLIYHYVAAHHYAPPEEFVDAVLVGPDPQSESYRLLLVEHGLEPIPPIVRVVIGDHGIPRVLRAGET